MWARLNSTNIVVETVTMDPLNRYHEQLVFFECPDDVKVGWVFDGDFNPPEEKPQDPLVAAKIQLSDKIQLADQIINIIKPAVDGGYAKPEHTKLLADWQRYRYELTLVPEQPGWPESPQWPTEPDKVI